MTEKSKEIFGTKEVCDLADPRSPNVNIRNSKVLLLRIIINNKKN